MCFSKKAFIALSPLRQCTKISKAILRSDYPALTPKATGFKMKIFKVQRLKTRGKLLDGPSRHWEVSASAEFCSAPYALLSLGGWGAGWHTHWQGSHRCPPHSPYHWSLEDTRTCSCPGCYGRDHGSCRAWRHTRQCQLYTADLETQGQWTVQSLEVDSHRNVCGAWASAGVGGATPRIFRLVSCFWKSLKASVPLAVDVTIPCRTSWFQTLVGVL